MKKIVSVLSAACLLLLVTVSAAAGSFVDVPEDAYYAAAAERMAEKGILTGYGDGYYYGTHNVTRAQMAVVACRLLGKEPEAKALAGKTDFHDVTDAHAWATGYINYAVANGIFVGDGDGNFRPDDNVKYEEAVKVIVCVLGLDENVKINPTDWSKEYIEAADAANLIDSLVGKKGEAMLRSDVAVLCDAAATVLEEQAEETAATTTKRIVGGSVSDKPATTTAKTTATTEPEPEPAVTTTVTTKATSEETLDYDNRLPDFEGPVVTTAATTASSTPVPETVYTNPNELPIF